MKKLKLFYLITLLIISSNCISQLTSTEDEYGNIQFKGIIEVPHKTNFQVSECISSLMMVVGITFKTETKEEAGDSSIVKGEYSYTYYVDDHKSFAGEVKFKFEYITKKGAINYRIYDFVHEKSNSKFNSIGKLPKEWNEKVGQVFTKIQFNEIISDLILNAANSIRIINKYCANNN